MAFELGGRADKFGNRYEFRVSHGKGFAGRPAECTE